MLSNGIPMLLCAVSALFALVAAAGERRGAFVELQGAVKGNITFVQMGDGPVVIFGEVTGLAPGKHGFHIHQSGDIATGCAAAGGHFNPDNKKHGGPDDSERHAGDLGNILANENGVAVVRLEDRVISLTGPHGVLGRAVVVHSHEDDLGRGGYPDSLTTGHAGDRVACGQIKIKFPPGPWQEQEGAAVSGHSVSSARRWSSFSPAVIAALVVVRVL